MRPSTRISLPRLSAALLAAALAASPAAAEELPVALQVQLLSKMPTYLASVTPPEGQAVRVLIVHPGPAASPPRGAQALAGAIGQLGQFGSHKAEAKLYPLGDGKALQAVLAAERPQVVYLAPELDEKRAAAVVEAALGSSAVTISGVASHVRLGVVLGFVLDEARPRVQVNLKQARRQGVEFRNGLLSHAVIVDR